MSKKMTICRGSDESMAPCRHGRGGGGWRRWAANFFFFFFYYYYYKFLCFGKQNPVGERHEIMARSSLLLLLAALIGAAVAFAPMPAARRVVVAAPAASTVVMTKCAGGGDGDPKGACAVCKACHDGLQQRHGVCVVVPWVYVEAAELNRVSHASHSPRAPRAGDKKRRGKIKSLVAKADSAEAFKALILTPTTESLLLQMNWKVCQPTPAAMGAQPRSLGHYSRCVATRVSLPLFYSVYRSAWRCSTRSSAARLSSTCRCRTLSPRGRSARAAQLSTC